MASWQPTEVAGEVEVHDHDNSSDGEDSETTNRLVLLIFYLTNPGCIAISIKHCMS